jgi:hypothetical protein
VFFFHHSSTLLALPLPFSQTHAHAHIRYIEKEEGRRAAWALMGTTEREGKANWLGEGENGTIGTQVGH